MKKLKELQKIDSKANKFQEDQLFAIVTSSWMTSSLRIIQYLLLTSPPGVDGVVGVYPVVGEDGE